MSSVLVIGGPAHVDYRKLGVRRIRCSPAAILGHAFSDTDRAVVYWPNRNCFLPALSLKQIGELGDRVGVSYESYLPARFQRRIVSKSGKARFKLSDSMAGRERTYRLTKSKLLEILALTRRGLICVVVVPNDFHAYDELAKRAFNWISVHLRIDRNRYQSGIQSIGNGSGCDEVDRILSQIPLDPMKWEMSCAIGSSEVETTWAHHIEEWMDRLELFARWPYRNVPVRHRSTHFNGNGTALSSVLLCERGAILVLPEVVAVGELIEIVKDALAPLGDTKPVGNPRLPHLIRLTSERKGIKGQQKIGYVVEYGGKQTTMGEISFRRLVAFVVAAKCGMSHINVRRPVIKDQKIDHEFAPIADNVAKVGQLINECLKKLADIRGVTAVPGKWQQGHYRLAISHEDFDLSKLKHCDNAALRSLLSILPAGNS